MLKKHKNKSRAIIFLALLLVGGSIIFVTVSALSGKYLTGRNSSAKEASTCSVKGEDHIVIIKNDKMSPVKTVAKRCDTLTIKNYDNKLREIGFGVHDHHVAYNGVTEKNLDGGQSFKLVLNKSGTYLFHDHFQDEVSGSFVVK